MTARIINLDTVWRERWRKFQIERRRAVLAAMGCWPPPVPLHEWAGDLLGPDYLPPRGPPPPWHFVEHTELVDISRAIREARSEHGRHDPGTGFRANGSRRPSDG
jgi:hypothetical protein